MSTEFDEGCDAAERDEPKSNNPYEAGSTEYGDWNAGYDWYTNGGV